jgi:hypothetical protein
MMPTLSHTPHIDKHNVVLVASHIINVELKMNCEFIEPQNGPTLCEYVIQGPCVILGETLCTFIYLSTPTKKNNSPFQLFGPMQNLITLLGC